MKLLHLIVVISWLCRITVWCPRCPPCCLGIAPVLTKALTGGISVRAGDVEAELRLTARRAGWGWLTRLYRLQKG